MTFPKGRNHKQKFQGVLFIVLLIIGILMAGNGFSAVIYVDPSATGNDDGTTWMDAYTNLQDGIDAGISGDEVWVAAGTYAGQTFNMAAGVDLYGGFTGTEVNREDRNWKVNLTILDGENTRRVINGASAGLYGFTITRGFNTSSGGGLYASGCSPVVENCCFTDNTVANSNSNGRTYGGAIYLTGSTITVTSCKFIGNRSRVSNYTGIASGGAVYVTTGSVGDFVNCLFEDNIADRSTSANSSRGGAIYQNDGTVTLTNCTVANNSATTAGALYGNFVVENCIVWGNSSNFNSSPTVTYSCIEGGYSGTGNIDQDPCFLSFPDDLRLPGTSPCLDAANGDSAPDTDIDGNNRYDILTVANTGAGTPDYVDMGAYERQALPYPGTLALNMTEIIGSGSEPEDERFEVWSSNGEIINYTIDSDVEWLSFVPDSGASTGEHDLIVVQYDSATFQPGTTYNATITVSAPDADNSPQTISVSYYVTQNVYVDATASGNNDGTSWTDAFTNLQDGINACSSGDEVWVAAGTYTGQTFNMAAGVDLYGGFTGTEVNREDRNWKVNLTILDGENTRRVINGASAGLYGFTITRGFNTSSGGGLYASGCSPVVENCCFMDNTVANSNSNGRTYGGAVYLTGSSLTMTSCQFTGNQSRVSNSTGVAYGGAVYVTAGSVVEFVNCLFEDNIADRSNSLNSSRGGAIYQNDGIITLTNCTLVNNSATTAGALYGNYDIANCIIWGNSSNFSGTPTVTYSCIEGGYSGTGNIDAIPGFLASPYDLRLCDTSPCIDAADGDAAPITDMEGNSAFDHPDHANSGTGTPAYRDMGAYERQSTPYAGRMAIDTNQFAHFSYHGSIPANDVFEIRASAGDTITYTITDNATWLSCTPSWGISAGEADVIRIAYDTSGLSAGAHNAVISIIDENAVNSPQTISVSVEVVDSNVVYVDLSATGNADGTCWTDAFTSIQPAIDAASSGDEVWVAQGTYAGQTITMKSWVYVLGGFNGTETQRTQRDWETNTTILDGETTRRVVTGTENIRLDGFTLQNGKSDGGAGMYCAGENVQILNCLFLNNKTDSSNMNNYGAGLFLDSDVCGLVENCTFSGNQALSTASTGYGGAFHIRYGNPTIRDCVFNNNYADNMGGALHCQSASPRIENCTLHDNSCHLNHGGAVYLTGGSPILENCLIYSNQTTGINGGSGGGVYANADAQITNCTIAGNTAKNGPFVSGGGIACVGSSPVYIENCIIWGNSNSSGAQIGTDGMPIVTYSCVQDGWAGEGNISDDPLFADSGNDDYHLKSTVGRWSGGGWMTDAEHSPCIDAGKVSDSFFNEPDVNGSQINMGAYGNTAEASKSDRVHHVITATSGSYGAISPGGSVYVADGHDFTFTMIPEAGNGVDDITVDSGSVGASETYTFTSVATDHTIHATFDAAWSVHSDDTLGGTITPDGRNPITQGHDRIYTITPDDGYVIGDVIVDGVSQGAVTEYTFTDLNQEHTISAQFDAVPFLQADVTVINAYTFAAEDVADNSLHVFNAGLVGAVDFSVSDDADWLSVSPAAGYSSGEQDELTVSFASSGLAEGLYQAIITIEDPAVANSPLSIPVNLWVGDVLYVDETASGSNNGMGWANAFNRLQDALAVSTTGHDIWVADGTYRPTDDGNRSASFSMKPGVNLYGGFAGTENAQEQRYWATNESILSGDIGIQGASPDNVYTVIKGASLTCLDGFVVEGGNANGADGAQDKGGGMYNLDCDPIIRHCTFRYNSATGYYGCGGAMYNSGAPTIMDCRFIANAAGGTYGVGGGGIYNTGDGTIINCFFENNSVSGFNPYGGAIKNDSASPTIQNCIFTGNSAGEGGAIENWTSSSPQIINCLFYDNIGAQGTAIDNDGAGSTCEPDIINCTFVNDSIMNKNSGQAMMRNCIFRSGTITGPAVVVYSNIDGGYEGDGNIDAAPLFVDTLTPAGADGIWRTQDDGFNLQAASPSKDTATADQAPGYDIRGDIRPVLAGVDMGAYEYDPYEYCGQTWYKDADNDGYSTGDTDTSSCTRPDGYRAALELTALTGDCDDTDANEHPGQTWYKDEDQDGYSDGATDTTSCTRPDGYKVAGELISMTPDCDDTDPDLFPGQAWYKDADNDGYSDGTTDTTSCIRPVGYKFAGELTALSGDCDDTDANAHPDQTWYKDTDNDDYTDGTTDTTSCLRPAGYKTASELVDLTLDEDDSDGAIYPGAPAMVDYNLLAHYPFNGNADDMSGNGNHGTVTDATLTNSRFGNTNSAYYFDGTDDWIIVSKNSGFVVNSFSINAWIRFEGNYNASGYAIISNYAGGETYQHYGLRLKYLNETQAVASFFYDDGSEWDAVDGVSVINDGEWHFISGSLDAGNKAEIYVDGQLENTDVASIPGSIDPTSDLYIGRDGTGEGTSGVQRWKGTIDDVRIYYYHLSVSDIEQLYNFADDGGVHNPNLINWNGNLVADFGDNGMWYHNGTNWNWMTNDGHVGQMVVWDGKLVVDFGTGKGIWYYDGSWHWMTNNCDPNMMIAWNNGTSEVLVVDYGAGNRIYTYDGTWHWFNNKDGVAGMTVWNNKLIVDFGSGRGVYNYDGTWNWMTNKDDVNLMQPWYNGATERLVVDFGGGRRIYTYDGTWSWFINKDDVNDMTVWNQKLVVDFGGGRCLYNYDTSWHWMNNKDDVARMVTWRDAASDLAVDFGSGRNMYNYNGVWSWIKNANNVPEMIAWNNRLAVDFGPGVGIYNYNGSWHQMKPWSTAD